jgi:hypothetical protein
MYIKLTKTDGSPIWLNASFVVTVEPNQRNEGSIVVPIGDGLDYEVKEAPQTVLSLLEGTAAPAIVPVPTTDALNTKTQNAAPEDEEAQAPVVIEEKPEKKKAAKRTATKTEKKASPKKKASAKTRSKKKAPLELDDTQLERLRKLAPKSLKKLTNTITAQFKVSDVEATITALQQHEVITLDADRVFWTELPQA